jgi:two-component system, OmpR family, sensor histidine kinase BaeS
MGLVIDLEENSMKFSLRTKLSITYAFVALIIVLLISILSNIFLENQFRDYIVNKQENQNEEITKQISGQYKGDGIWDVESIENIGLLALDEGLIIKVIDNSNNSIWDATVHNFGLCTAMLDHISANMTSRYPNWKGDYVENSYKLARDSEVIGSVEIGYYGPFFFNDNELAFINTLNSLLIFVGILSLLVALVLGHFMSRRLSRPITKAVKFAQTISTGNYEERIINNDNTKELVQLTDTLNYLADTIEENEIMQKRLTSDVAHELRTPLTTLQSHIEAMLDGVWKPEKHRLEGLHSEIVRITKIVGDLESLTRFEDGNIIINEERIELLKFIKGIAKSLELQLKEKNAVIEVLGKEVYLVADKDKLSQIFINIIANAIKYIEEDGIIKINLKESDKWVNISVVDNGIGIGSEDLPHIFDRFYRSDKSRNRETGGSGIGLTIAKTLVDAHKGMISVESKLGEGTEFIIKLPKE